MSQLDYITKVVKSCITTEQKDSASNWISTLQIQNKITKEELISLISLLTVK